MAYETLKLSRDAFTEATWLCGELPSAGRVEFLDTWCWTEDAEPGWRKLVIEAYCSGMRSRTEQLCRPAAGLLGEEWPKRRLDALGLKRIAAGIQGDEVELSIDEQHIKGEKGRPGTIERRLIVSAKRSKFSLKLKAMEAEPQAWPVSATAYHVLYAADLARILGRTRFAIDRGHSH
ncbi:MAG TPA: hypothetical protein VGE52_06840, partial [Pirellulales bacterium]